MKALNTLLIATRKRSNVVSLLALLVCSLSSMGAIAQAASIEIAQVTKPSPGAQSDLGQLTKAAQSEGELTFYSGMVDAVNRNISAAFQEKYGIKVAYLRIVGTQLMPRYASEAESGVFAADLLILTRFLGEAFRKEAFTKGWIEQIAEAGLPALKSGEYPAKFNHGETASVQLVPWLIGYNTQTLKTVGVEPPKTWNDVLNPKLKGSILLVHPDVGPHYVALYALLAEKFGDSYLTRLASQNPRWQSGSEAAIQSLAAGEGTVMVPAAGQQVFGLQAKGAPVGMSQPDEANGPELEVILTSRKKAKHPNAARLFANYILSVEGNTIINKDSGSISVYDSERLPKQWEALKVADKTRTAQIKKLLGL